MKRRYRVGSNPPYTRSFGLIGCALLIGAGLVVGWPALDGGFVGADDEYLILNHALVNHPSLEHAVKLFVIPHRDLYQPIPLLTFQIEFALFGDHLNSLAAAMHRTNLAIHILNGLLVWVLFRRLVGGRFVPLTIALLFVTHPLAVECFAWINGRMIMLSTTFVLASLIVFDCWCENRRVRPDAPYRGKRSRTFESPRGLKPAARCASSSVSAVRNAVLIVCVIVLVALTMMCKVRVGLPILLGVLPVWRRYKPNTAWWAMFSGIVALTIVFAAINFDLTRASRMFEGAQQQLAGPNAARAVQSLGWYLMHYVWPVGLAPYYAPPPVVAWTDWTVLTSLAVLLATALIAIGVWRRSRVGVVGLAWFLAAVAATLIIPARNLLAADRYVYLSNIGLHWIAASIMVLMYHKLTTRWSERAVRGIGLAAVGALVALWAGAGREVTNYYESNDAQLARVIEVSPDHPTLRTNWGWYHFERGDYAEGIRLADEELALFPNDDIAFSRALNLRAMCRYRLSGDVAGAASDLSAAIERDADFAKSYFRLALVYYEQGRLEEAIAQLEVAVAKDPQFNPALNLLGNAYRRRQQPGRAREMFERAVANSQGYDVEAIQSLGALDLEQGLYEQAEARFAALLAWHDVGIEARLSHALALRSLNRDSEAWDQYVECLRREPLNRQALIGAADLLRSAGRYGEALNLWAQAARAEPQAADLQAWHALHHWYRRDLAASQSSVDLALAQGQPGPIAQLTVALIAVARAQPAEIAARSQEFLDAEMPDIAPMFTYGYEALEFYSSVDNQSPWPYYVTVVLLLKEGKDGLVERVRSEFDRRCPEPQWRQNLQRLYEQYRGHRPAAEP